MRIRSFDEMTAVDPRAKVFAGRLDDVQAPDETELIRRLQERIAGNDLVAAVPGSVRDNFERLQSMHAHGAFLYDLYSVVEQTHALVLEQALGERFIRFHRGDIPFVDKKCQTASLNANTFREVFNAVRTGGSHHQTRHLVIDDSLFLFSPSFYGLLRWARRHGFLRGQRNRFRENALRELRNEFAHPSGHSVTGPVESARAISTLAETINHLWGHATEGGSRYPPPLVREVLLVGRSADGASRTLGYPDAMTEGHIETDWDYFVVRARREDGSLMDAGPPFSQTNLPTELLWGPGSCADALRWVDREDPGCDTIDHLDRVFSVQSDGTRFPVEIENDTRGEDVPPHGTWALIRADFPLDALGHIRGLQAKDSKHSTSRFCPECPVETLHHAF